METSGLVSSLIKHSAYLFGVEKITGESCGPNRSSGVVKPLCPKGLFSESEANTVSYLINSMQRGKLRNKATCSRKY